jgi:putative transposase
MDLKQKIITIYHDSRRTYGSPRIHQTLLREGYQVSKKRVERLMRETGIYAVAKKKYRATTDSKHSLPVAPNSLNRNFSVNRPNQSWVADITYIYTLRRLALPVHYHGPLFPQNRGVVNGK